MEIHYGVDKVSETSKKFVTKLQLSTRSRKPFTKDTLAGYSNIHTLVLHSKLGNIPKGMFSPCKNLKFLHSNFGEFEKPPEELSTITTLEYLNLDYCDVTEIPEDFFSRMPNLKAVQVAHAKIKSLPKNLFKYNKKLQDVILWLDAKCEISAGLFDSCYENFYHEDCFFPITFLKDGGDQLTYPIKLGETLYLLGFCDRTPVFSFLKGEDFAIVHRGIIYKNAKTAWTRYRQYRNSNCVWQAPSRTLLSLLERYFGNFDESIDQENADRAALYAKHTKTLIKSL